MMKKKIHKQIFLFLKKIKAMNMKQNRNIFQLDKMWVVRRKIGTRVNFKWKFSEKEENFLDNRKNMKSIRRETRQERLVILEIY